MGADVIQAPHFLPRHSSHSLVARSRHHLQLSTHSYYFTPLPASLTQHYSHCLTTPTNNNKTLIHRAKHPNTTAFAFLISLFPATKTEQKKTSSDYLLSSSSLLTLTHTHHG